ncbi:hypothetical protein JGS22_007220 [Streptomyces sp. P38-E01]|uniref:Peptide chain release factor 1 n=1 Tax=Streptomyces tardus TaxID=2780544 RepID=A0A949N4Y0_9ACTN|nr:Vms1/Ankzf1 family peptidyl-tRNA hydrolase [Streptomyces tardus]MBU7597427.1 hypothetical protein [Streptomyces tardus]
MELAFLSPVLHHPGPWASAYVAGAGAGPDSADQQELAAREVRHQLSRQGADERTQEAVYEELRTPVPEEEGRAVFAADGEVRLATPLRAAPPLPEAQWSPLPHLSPLVEHLGEERRCLVAYVDREGADFELRSAEGSEELGQAQGLDWPLSRTSSGDPSESHFQEAVENTWEKNAATVADRLTRVAARTHPDAVLLVGEDRQRAAVLDKLPVALRPLTTQTDRGGRAAGSGTDLLEEEIAELLAEQEHRHGARVLERFRVGRARGANTAEAAVEDVASLLEAAREHRIETLLLRPGGPDTNTEVWVGEEPDQIALRRSETKYLGDPEPSSARADDALLRAVAATGGTAVVVDEPRPDSEVSPEGEPVAQAVDEEVPVGGIGAVLRWSQPEPATG